MNLLKMLHHSPGKLWGGIQVWGGIFPNAPTFSELIHCQVCPEVIERFTQKRLRILGEFCRHAFNDQSSSAIIKEFRVIAVRKENGS